MMHRLDKTAFTKGTHTQVNLETKEYMHHKTPQERWQIGTYLTSIAYGFEGRPLPRMEKIFIRKGKHIQ